MSNNESLPSVALPQNLPSFISTPATKDADSFIDPVECLPEIASAGFVYPFIVACIGLPFVVYHEIGTVISSGNYLDLLFACFQILLFLLTFGIFGMLVALFVGMFTLGFYAFANWTLGQPLSPIAVATCGGGLAGYIPLAAPFLSPIFVDQLAPVGAIVAFLLGPTLAMIVGQSFARMSFRKKRNTIYYAILTLEKSQFQISTILTFTFWCAILFTGFRLLAGTNFVWLLVIYILTQTLMLVAANAIAKAKLRREARA